MSDCKSRTQGSKTLVSVIFIIATVLSTLVCSFFAAETANSAPYSVIFTGTPLLILSVFSLSLSLTALGKKALFAVSPAVAAVLSYLSFDVNKAIIAFLSLIVSVLCSLLIYYMYFKNSKHSSICAGVSFTLILCELIRCCVPILIYSRNAGQHFSTVLFERLGLVIDETVNSVSKMFETASTLYPELENALTGSEISLLRASASMSVSLVPAFSTCIYFAAVLLILVIMDALNKKYGFFPERSYGKYSVDRPVYIIFNVLTVLYILSLFLGSSTGLFAGLLSALTFMFPHFAILGIRRLFRFFAKSCTGVIAVIILMGIAGVGLAISPQLLFWVIIFFGTSEYRACELARLEEYGTFGNGNKRDKDDEDDTNDIDYKNNKNNVDGTDSESDENDHNNLQ